MIRILSLLEVLGKPDILDRAGAAMMRDKTKYRILLVARFPEALHDVLQGMGSYIKQRHVNWMIQCIDADEFVSMLKPSNADGAVAVVEPRERNLLAKIRRSGVPVVNLFHDAHSALPSVLSDDSRIGATAARYLMERGFRTFAYLGFDSEWSHARCAGFKESVSQKGYECHVSPTCTSVKDYHFMDTNRADRILRRWVASLPRPVAIFACSDLVVRSLLTACQEVGLRVPEEAAILGVDNRVSVCELTQVPLSSVMQDFIKLGHEAARLLDRVMTRVKIPPWPILVPPLGIAARRSTEVLAFDDEHISAAMRLIHEHAIDGISMKELLRQVPVSRKWLDIRFKAVIGHTPSQEIRKLRLSRVRDLLLHTDLSIRQIAGRSGFNNAENLVRFFRAAEGIPPQKFRHRSGN